jgi:hypothetical protein
MTRPLALTGVLFIAFNALSQAPHFDPSGHWSIRFEDLCSGMSQVRTSSEAIQSDKPFQCSSYLEKDKPPLQAEIDVRYDAKTNSVTLVGGPSQLPRRIPLDEDGTGVSHVKLFPKTVAQSKGCDLDTYFLEGIRFVNSNKLEYRYITVNEFIPHQDHPDGCKAYLSELKTAVQRRTATGFLLAMRDTNAIQVKSMPDLASIDLISSFSGSRKIG